MNKAARIAGAAYLISFVTVVAVEFGIQARLVTPGNPAQTAQNILAHQSLFRIGIAGDLIYCTGVFVLLIALYVILEPVNRGVALVAALFRFVYTSMWLLATTKLFDALRVVRSSDLQPFARLYLGARSDLYYVGLFFGAVASTLFAWLWLKSNYIPKGFAAFGVIASAWCVLCTCIFILVPAFANVVNLWWFDTPMGLFEIALSFWLLIKGLPGEVTA
jgi:uncharacterized protein DUF4386